VRRAKDRELERDIEPYATKIAQYYMDNKPKPAAAKTDEARRLLRVPKGVDEYTMEARLQTAISHEVRLLQDKRQAKRDNRNETRYTKRRLPSRLHGFFHSRVPDELLSKDDRKLPAYKRAATFHPPLYEDHARRYSFPDYYQRNGYRY
jgi:hypothetical protein